MGRYGLFCFLGRGHLDPGLAIGRELQARGHEVTVFHLTVAQAAVRAAGLSFAPLDRDEPATAATTSRRGAPRIWHSTVEAMASHAARTLREGPAALRAARLDAVIADQLDVAAGTIADRLGLPFVTTSCGPPIYLDDSIPAPYFGWPHAADIQARARNRRAHAWLTRRAAPLLDLVNTARRDWHLPSFHRLNDVFSRRGIITQLPTVLELPRTPVPHLFYTGPFRDHAAGRPVRFDWDRLDGRPLVYATMGTVRNTSAAPFRVMAEACHSLDVQLVISLGGGRLQPAHLGALPGNPIVVHYAPQRALLERASLAIHCAGMNTTLDAVACGVPMVALPVAEDQPGVAARIAHAGIGVVEPAATMTTARLRQAIVTVLQDSRYREAACRVSRQLAQIDGRARAVDLIEAATHESGLPRTPAVPVELPV